MRKLLTKISMVLLAAIIGLSPLVGGILVAAESVYESSTSTSWFGPYEVSGSAGAYISQSFTPSVTHMITGFSFYKESSTGPPTAAFRASLYLSDANGKRTGAELTYGEVPANSANGVVKFTITPYLLTSGIEYTMMLWEPGGVAGKYWHIPYHGSKLYANGSYWKSFDSGANWNQLTSNRDIYFVEYGVENPEVTTTAATSITATTATLNGTLDTLGIEAHGHVYFGYDEGGGPAYDHYTSPVFKDTLGAYSSNLTGLTPETKYYFTAFIWNAGETISYSGSELNFTTLSQTVVETKPATSITVTTATLNGDLTDLGEETDVDVYFGYYASGEIPYHHLTAGVNKNATGTFSANITNLLGGTKYYFAAFATNGVDIWSTVSPLEFTTDDYPYVTSRDTMNTIIAYVVLLVIILLCIVVALSPIDSIIKLFAIITLILFFIIFEVLFNALGFIF
jgi:hypothetical protein